MRNTLIAVSGSNEGDPRLTREVLGAAEEVGRQIALAGCVLLCGGLGGVMEAAARGAKEAGGLTVGILPFGRQKANPFIDIPLATGIGYARNSILVSSCDAMIVVCGRWGTLNELAFAMGIDKPVVVLAGSNGVADLWSRQDVRRVFRRVPELAATPAEAVGRAVALAKEADSEPV